jgi:hypothetical protein
MVDIRTLALEDITALLALEREVWSRRGIESIDERVGKRWIEEGVCLGAFNSGELVAYAYAETIQFRPIPPYSPEILDALESYKETSSVPNGNAFHGLSMSALRPGTGASLLAAIVAEAQRRHLEYFVSLARLEGLGRFIKENPELQSRDIREVACLYAIQTVSWVDSALVGAPLSLFEVPPDFPKVRRKDPVVSRFARLGKELWGVAETSFFDPQSLGYSALLVLTL